MPSLQTPFRASTLLIAATLFSLALGAFAGTTRAGALEVRGHVFDGTTIGSPGTGAGQLEGPSAVAVEESTGDIYVADRGNGRVDIFHADGEPVSSFSGTPSSKLTRPEAIAVDNSAPASGDPSAGDVYVLQKGRVYKFDSHGNFLATVVGKELSEELGTPLGVAVDPAGHVWVDFAEDEILSFDDAKENRPTGTSFESELETLRYGLAVDSEEDLYVRYEPAEEAEEGARGCNRAPCFIGELTSHEEPVREFAPGEPLLFEMDSENGTGVAVDAGTDGVYVDQGTEVAAFDHQGRLLQRFGSGALSEGAGIAVNSATDTVYVADAAAGHIDVFEPQPEGPPTVDSAATLTTSADDAEVQAQIDPVGAATSYSVQYATSQCTGTPAGCVEGFACASGPEVCGESPVPPGAIAAGFGAQRVTTEIHGLAPHTVYYYRFVARNSHGLGASPDHSLLTQPAGPSTVADERQWELVSPADKFGYGVEPIRLEGGAVQAADDGHALAYIANGPLTATPEGNRSPEPTQILSTRDPETGWSSQDITTPNDESSGVEPGNNGGEYKLFSPNLSLAVVEPFDKNALSSPPLSPPLTPHEAQAGQQKTLYLRADAPLESEASGASIYSEAVANGEAMGNAGYVALVNELNVPGVNLESSAFAPALKFVGASPDLTHVVISSRVALTGPEQGAKLGVEGARLYEWSAGALQQVSILPEGEHAPGAATLGLGNLDIRHAVSDDGTRVVWSSGRPEQQGHLYLRDTAAETTARVDAVQSSETSIRENGFPGGGAARPIFQIASADASRVFFTDTQRLTGDARATERLRDLYVYETATGTVTDLTVPLPPAKKNGVSEPADVREVLLGASEDGSYAYFVANGVLDTRENAEHERAGPGSCPTGAPFGHRKRSTCGLYVVHASGHGWERPRFIATLSSEDGPDWQSANPTPAGVLLRNHTAGSSPDGNYLAFMSNRSLTGQDNTDQRSGEPDEQVFLYDALTERLVCASCNPSGARPLGVHDLQRSGEGLGLLVDRPGSWMEQEGEEHGFSSWLAGSIPGWVTTEGVTGVAYHQPDYLADSGRLYFNSADALSPADTNGKEDVYEYEPAGVPAGPAACSPASSGYSATVSGCVGLISGGSGDRESAFLDASQPAGANSAGGGDVFFLTAAPLLARDSDTNFDVYDAHECTASAPCLSPAPPPAEPCEGEAGCKGAFTPGPASAAPAAGPSSGNLNPQANVLASRTTGTGQKAKPLTRAQLLKRALHSCHKLKRKTKRKTCERRVRRRYAPKKGHHR